MCPAALSPEHDRRLQQELRRTGDLPATALLLTRATGRRIGECLDLAPDCLRQLGLDQWALHVPLGKLHTERLVPPIRRSASWSPAWGSCALWLPQPCWPAPRDSYFPVAPNVPSIARCGWHWP